MYAAVVYRKPSTGLSDDPSTASSPGILSQAGSAIGSIFTGIGNIAGSLAPAAAGIATALRQPTQYPYQGTYGAPAPMLAPTPSFDWTPVLLIGGVGLVALVVLSKKKG